ncbi:MAG: hypothetical protein GX110_00100, partial [Synergistaceae bacterium]|nr:hypothetical protein [Synergistaceae bacterium]
PRWTKALGFVTGLFLLGDGLRRLLAGGSSAASFVPYILVGSACVYIAGYDKKITLSEKGFLRETLFWGRGKTDLLQWEEMEELILLPSAKGTGVVFPVQGKGWRAFFPGVSEEEIREAAALYRPDLPVLKSGV